MTFLQKRKSVLAPQKELWISTFLYALLVAAAFFVPFIIMGKGYFLFFGDFNVQQIPFYQMCHQMVRSGNIGWNIYTDLGVNFVGSYSFYLLGSPFFWLTLPFPNSFVPYLMGPLLILKFSLSALTAYFYLRRFTKTAYAARLGALLYAFSGFSVYNIFFNHFHEAIVLFPLLLLSVETAMADKRRGPFAFTVFLCALSNYFLFFGMVVFVAIYWIVRVLCGAWKIRIGDFLLFVFEAVLGVAAAAVLLYPSALALMGNGRLTDIGVGWNAILYGKNQIFLNILQTFFFPPDLPARPVFFPGADVKWSSLGGWLPLFGMVGFVAFWQAKKGHWLRRVLGIYATMALIPILNSAFYLFNDAYYARWFYMPILLLALCTAIAAEDEDIPLESAWRWVLGITLAATAVIGFFPAEIKEGKVTAWGLFTDGLKGDYYPRFFITCAISILSLVIVYILNRWYKKDRNRLIKNATAYVCIISVAYSAIFINWGKSHSYSDKIMINDLIESTLSLPGDSNTYRVDVYDGVDNTAMYLGLPAINAFHSIVPPSVTEFYEYVGEERGVASRPTAKTYAIRSLLSVKYLLNGVESEPFLEDGGKPRMPGFVYHSTEQGFNIYSNENYIPYGFVYEYYMTSDQCSAFGKQYRADMMLKALLLNDSQIEKYGKYMQPFREYTTVYDEQGIGTLQQNVNFGEDAFSKDCETLRSTAAYSFEYTNSGFSAKIKLDKPNLVFFSVPYDSGFSATVNGKAAKIEKVNVGFCAVLCQKGENEIKFTYTTPGLMSGAKVSAGALAVMLLYYLAFVIYRKKHPVTPAYREGDIPVTALGKTGGMQDNTPPADTWFDDDGDDISFDLSESPSDYGMPKTIDGGFEINDDFLKDLPTEKEIDNQ